MKDEIKEILQKIENVANRGTASRNALMEMKDTDYQLLLDYITNLQQENERLKENNQAYQEELCKTWDERDNLYRKIYMAIDYIQEDIIGNYFKIYDDEIYKMCADLLNILKGDSDETV